MFPVEEGVTGLDCRHVFYCPPPEGVKKDLHIVKEYKVHADGTREPNVRLVWDYKRKFWTTKELFRNHNDKKEYEHMSKLKEHECTQSQLADRVSRALYGKPCRPDKNAMRQLSNSQYLYGTDLGSVSLIKADYQKDYPNAIGLKSTVAVLDIETDVVEGHDEIIVVTLSFGSKIVTAVNTKFIPDTPEDRKLIEDKFQQHLAKYIEKRKLKLELLFCKSPGICCAEVMKRAHAWKPDFIEVWNINFDLPKIIQTLEEEGFDLPEVFSDPLVPEEYRFFRYNEGKSVKVTAAGKKTPMHPADRWHTVDCPASFYFIDGMCLYKYLRTADGMVSSYGLDATLKRHIGTGKLGVAGADHLDGLPWHKEMQKNFKHDYVVYNDFDCVGVEELDETIKDVCQKFPIQVALSDFRHYRSNPRKICDKFTAFLLGRGMVIGTTGVEMVDEFDDMTVSLDNWIVTLAANLMADEGLLLIHGAKGIRSLIYSMLADLDIVGTYPSLEILLNISKETTHREIIEILGLSEKQRRNVGINLSGGKSNSIEVAVNALKAKTPQEWLELFDKMHPEYSQKKREEHA